MSATQTTETTDTVSNTTPNPVAEAGNEQATDAATTEPEQCTCVEDCGRQGPADEFLVQDFQNLVRIVIAARTEPSNERVVITPELVAKYATCNECADKIRVSRGVRYFPLAGALQRANTFQRKSDAVATVMGSPVMPTAIPATLDLDPEAATLVACWVCGHEQSRAAAYILGWWGAQLTAAARLRKQNGNENRPLVRVTSEMLLETTKAKSLVVCDDCVPQVGPRLAEQASDLPEISDLSDKEQMREVRRRLGSFPLMTAIHHARRRETDERFDKEREAADEAARAKANEERQATIGDLFLVKAREPKNGSGRSKGADRQGRKPRGGRWDNDE